MGVKKILQRRMKSTIAISVWFLVSFLGLVSASQLSIDAPTTIYQSCIQPYIVKMDTNGTYTKSVDVKLLLTWYFDINSPYSTISEALITSTWYAEYIPWYFDITALQTGTATSWTNENRPYLYVNAYQLGLNSSVIGSDISLATLYLRSNVFTTWYLDFYFIAWRNGDDSNISSGIDEEIISGSYTQYVDSLDSVSNLEQSFSWAMNYCTSRPYISGAYYRQTWYISTSTGVQAVRTSVVAWPLYSGTSNRTLWTKWDVKLFLTGVSDSYAGSWWLVAENLSTWIQLTHVDALNDPYISLITTTTWRFTQYYEVRITGDVSTWFVWFDNIIGNAGYTYLSGWQKYADEFNVDVFWIDTVSPVNTWYFTGYISNTGVGFTDYTLSGTNFSWRISNPINGFHADRTSMDDEYKVLSFSGINSITQDCNDKWYACATTWYMDYLNTTGYVRSGDNVFKLIHDIFFTTSFSGYATVIDRAGNTGQRGVYVNMDNFIVVNYWLIAYTEAAWYRTTTYLSGMLLKLAIYSGGFDKERLLGSGWAGIELVYTGRIKTSSTGYSDFTWNFASGQYWVLAEWVDTLSYLISWVNLSPFWWLIDFGAYYPDGFVLGDLNKVNTTSSINHADYGIYVDRNQQIVVADLAYLVILWGKWNNVGSNGYEWSTPGVWVYTWSLFVDTPVNPSDIQQNKIASYNSLQSFENQRDYMQYHSFDVDADGLVNLNDYNIVLANLWNIWITNWWRLDWLSGTPATMPF